MTCETVDVIVVGAGAAGLWAAGTAAARGLSVLLIEKNKKLGVKILMSGGTRCNITHNTSWRGVADAFGQRQGRFLKFGLASLPPEKVVEVFHRHGVKTKVEDTGKVFPSSDRAIDVRNALVERARNAGASILNETPVTDIKSLGDCYSVVCSEQEFQCRSLVLTSGGQSYPGCGTTGDGYAWMQRLGHSLVAPRPALTPLKSPDAWVHRLSGVTLPDVSLGIQLQDENPRLVRGDRSQFRGSFLFTHKGCSGPTSLNISRLVTEPSYNVPKKLVCDWLPELNEDRLRDSFTNPNSNGGGKQVLGWLSQHLPRRMAQEICQLSDVSPDRTKAEVGRKQLSRLIQHCKRCEVTIAGTLGFAKAEVTAGGIDLSEIDPKTMESKLAPRLYLAGEILDVDGPIGGYNFQAAFSTAEVAANAIAKC